MRRIGSRVKEFVFGLAIILGAVLFILLSPVLIPIAGIAHQRDIKRMRELARTFICLNCGKVLGKEAIGLGDEAWSRHIDEVLKQCPPRTRLRVVRTVHAVCPHCGALYQYIDKARSFAPSPMHPSAHSAN
jgi:predicted RNA-binding Zn-ribbon protein involved in translation (DUF1610 family)